MIDIGSNTDKYDLSSMVERVRKEAQEEASKGNQIQAPPKIHRPGVDRTPK